MKNSVLHVSGPDTLQNTIKITSKTKFSIHFVQIPYHLHLARQGAHLEAQESIVPQHRRVRLDQAQGGAPRLSRREIAEHDLPDVKYARGARQRCVDLAPSLRCSKRGAAPDDREDRKKRVNK